MTNEERATILAEYSQRADEAANAFYSRSRELGELALKDAGLAIGQKVTVFDSPLVETIRSAQAMPNGAVWVLTDKHNAMLECVKAVAK